MNDENIDKSIISGSKTGVLPLARTGHAYRTLIGYEFLSAGDAVCWLIGLENTGLSFYPDKNMIAGMPGNSGDFDILICIRRFDRETQMEQYRTLTLKLTIEDDFNLQFEDVDEDDPYWKPDEDTKAIQVNFSKRDRLKKDMAAASLRGLKHYKGGKIREDDFCIRYDRENRWYVLAVADGSSRAMYSRRGSKIACENSVNHCLEQLSDQSQTLRNITVAYRRKKKESIIRELSERLFDIIASSVTYAHEDIVAEAKRLNNRLDDYETTLLMCVCKKFEFGWLIGSFAAGDGAICLFDKENWYANLLGGIENDSENIFLTAPEVVQPIELENRIRFSVVEDFTALIVMTRGVSVPKFGSANNLPCFELWNKLWNDISSQLDFTGKIERIGEQLLKWLGFWAPGKYDDRTIAAVF